MGDIIIVEKEAGIASIPYHISKALIPTQAVIRSFGKKPKAKSKRACRD